MFMSEEMSRAHKRASLVLDCARRFAQALDSKTLTALLASDVHSQRAIASAALTSLRAAQRIQTRDATKYVDATFVCLSCMRAAFVSREAFDLLASEDASVKHESDANDSFDLCTLCACALDDDDIALRALSAEESKTRDTYLDERIT